MMRYMNCLIILQLILGVELLQSCHLPSGAYELGSSIAMSWNTLFLWDRSVNDGKWRVYIYTKSGWNWVYSSTLEDNTLPNNSYYWTSVDVEGDYLVVGWGINMYQTSSVNWVLYIYKKNWANWDLLEKKQWASTWDWYWYTLDIDSNKIIVSSQKAWASNPLQILD